MKYLILLLSALCLMSCEQLNGPNNGYVDFPVTYIEWESIHPQDTTWWTLCATGVVMAAYKQKITMVNGAPPWDPMCIGTDAHGNCVPELNKNGDTIGADGRTHAQYNAFWAAQIAGYLPIKYYEGTWGQQDGLITVNVNQVVPGLVNGVACSMDNPTWVTSQWAPMYWSYSLWTDDSLFGYQADEYGNRIPLLHSSYNMSLSKWHGQQLYDSSNPIFRE